MGRNVYFGRTLLCGLLVLCLAYTGSESAQAAAPERAQSSVERTDTGTTIALPCTVRSVSSQGVVSMRAPASSCASSFPQLTILSVDQYPISVACLAQWNVDPLVTVTERMRELVSHIKSNFVRQPWEEPIFAQVRGVGFSYPAAVELVNALLRGSASSGAAFLQSTESQIMRSELKEDTELKFWCLDPSVAQAIWDQVVAIEQYRSAMSIYRGTQGQ
jgi:hypothetical protein